MRLVERLRRRIDELENILCGTYGGHDFIVTEKVERPIRSGQSVDFEVVETLTCAMCKKVVKRITPPWKS